jgi:hypothetical protein
MLTPLHTGSAAESVQNLFDTADVSLIIVSRLWGERLGYYVRFPAIVDFFYLHQSVQIGSETHKASSLTSIREISPDVRGMLSLFLKIQINVTN